MLGILLIPNTAMAFYYTSTYDMLEIVQTASFKANKNDVVQVDTVPNKSLTKAPAGSKIYLHLFKKTFTGYSPVDKTWNDAFKPDTAKSLIAPETGEYKVRLRNDTNKRMVGKVSISVYGVLK